MKLWGSGGRKGSEECERKLDSLNCFCQNITQDLGVFEAVIRDMQGRFLISFLFF